VSGAERREPASEYADDFLALAEIAEVFTQLVSAVTAAETTTMSLDQLVDLAVRCTPRARGAVVIALVDGVTRTLATSSRSGELLGRAVAATEQGPSIDVIEANDVVLSDDLTSDPRWPLLGEHLRGVAEITSAVSYRLYLGSRHRAALTFHSDWPHAFDNLALSTGAIFAAYASLTLSHELLYRQPVPPAEPAACTPRSALPSASL